MYKRKASKSTLLLMELVVVIFVFALCATVCLGLFSTSQRMTEDSDDLNHAVMVSRTAASCYKAGNSDLNQMVRLMNLPAEFTEDGQVLVYFDAQWNPTATVHDDGFYLQITALTESIIPLQEADIAVYRMDQTAIFQMQVKKTVLHTGGVLYDTK